MFLKGTRFDLIYVYPWTSSYWTSKSSFFLTNDKNEGEYLGPKSHPAGGFFIILKNSHEDLSDEVSNLVLSSLEVGH